MSGEETHPTELAWAKSLAGELRGLDRWRHRWHVAVCASCRQLEADMARERSAFDASPRRRDELALLQARAAPVPRAPHPSSWERLRWIAAGCAVAATVAVVAIRPRIHGPSLVEKGGGALTMYVERPAGAVALGARCAPGDRLIARYRTERPYLLLLERDGRGVVQVLVPRDGSASLKLLAAEGTTPTSWILDAAPGRECFAAFFSDEPLAAAPASRAFRESTEALVVPGATVRVQCCDKGPSR